MSKSSSKSTHYSVTETKWRSYKAYCGIHSWHGLQHSEDIREVDCMGCTRKLLKAKMKELNLNELPSVFTLIPNH